MRTCSSFGTLSLRKTDYGSFLQVNDVPTHKLGVRSESKLGHDQRYKSYTMNWVKHLNQGERMIDMQRNNKLQHIKTLINNTNSTNSTQD